ncbi:hypothetical protein H5410_015232 [Solanum commersonii]|uniref:Uncharacterized protein n=1 Tax=Solanum commersonii TaxID=4109 RepID=A0A9J5ZT96_SOLCO|nr:hypothetical protein H5410_015232 [Solanum commersonii]
MPGKITEALTSWEHAGLLAKNRGRWRIVPASIWWTIWEERNSRCFESIENSKRQIKLNCILLLRLKTETGEAWQKAFGHVNWNFLLNMLQQMGFKVRCIKWLRFCISIVRFSVIIDGSLEGFFLAQILTG